MYIYTSVFCAWVWVSTYRLALGRRADAKRRRPPHGVEEGNQQQRAAEAVQNRRGGHAQDAQPDDVRGAADDEERRDGRDGHDGDPGQHVEAPAGVGAERAVEALLLDEAQGADGELEVRGPAPDGGDDGEDDPALDVAGVVQAIVQRDWQGRGVDEDEEGEDEEPPAAPPVVPREGQLGQQLRVVVVVLLEGAPAALPLAPRRRARVVVGRGGRAQRVREAAPGRVDAQPPEARELLLLPAAVAVGAGEAARRDGRRRGRGAAGGAAGARARR